MDFIHSTPTIRHKRVQTIIREIASSNNYQTDHFKHLLQTINREIIPNKTYKLLPEKSLEKMLANYYPIIISNHTYKLFIREREIIPSSSYKLLPDKSSLGMIFLIIVYERIISNNTSKLLSEN